MRSTALSLGYKAAGAAIVSTTLAAFLTVASSQSGMLSVITPRHSTPSKIAAGVLGVGTHARKPATAAAAAPRVSAVGAALPVSGSGAASERSASRALHGSVTGSGGGVRLTSAPDPGTPLLKPALVGLLNRGGPPPTAYRAGEGGYVVNGTQDDQGISDGGYVSWAELQPAAGGAIAANNSIDQAISDVRAWNLANPAHPEALKVRIASGVHSPAWALNLGGSCFQVTDPSSGASGCCPRFWTTEFSTAYYQFEAELAAEYDNTPEVGEIVMAKNTTVYNESLIGQTADPATLAALNAAGYTTALDEQEQVQNVESLGTYWKYTHVGFAFNPYQTSSPVGTSEAFTQTLMSDGRQALGAQLVIENNSLRSDYLAGSGNYQTMYAFMVQSGGPIGFQTSTLARTGSLTGVLDGALSMRAGNVELPSGYESDLTAVQIAAINAQF